jgi:hypothetical protein
MKELNTQPDMVFVENYRSDWKDHVLRMPRPRIPPEILRYELKRRFLGRLFKSWDKTVTGLLGLRRGGLMVMTMTVLVMNSTFSTGFHFYY